LILLVIMVILGIYWMTAIHNSLEQIISDRYRKVVVANDIIDQVNAISLAMRILPSARTLHLAKKKKNAFKPPVSNITKEWKN
jgi:hypothetical protein